MKIDIPLIEELNRILTKSKVDPLYKFVSGPEEEKFEKIQKQNFDNFISLCKDMNVRYVYLGKGEICGCEGRAVNRWPAMWKIADMMGYPGSCGNGDQYQAMDHKGIFYPAEAYGHWDLLENRKLTADEASQLKFKHVVDR